MDRGPAWEELRTRVLDRIRPTDDEDAAVGAFVRRLKEEMTRRLRGEGLDAVAEAHGSVARGTWLSGERDIDLFLILDARYDRQALHKALDAAKAYVGEGWVEAYAEHPYIRASVEGFDVEFIPCFRFDPARGLISSTDRTPLHTRLVNERLAEGQRDEVRLLKQFARGVGVYGAEVKVGGFSGYLCELLILRMGGFEAVLRGASTWRRGEAVDAAGEAEARGLRERFRDPLIFVDPVDAGRNVASAVSETSMWTFVAAARAFLRAPSERFFSAEGVDVDPQAVLRDLEGRRSRLLFLVIGEDGGVIPDILWGQLHRAERAISRNLEKREFRVIRSAAWSDEATRHIMIFELESAALPEAAKVRGPPVELAESSDRFLRVHLEAASTLAGPWIEGRRWWLEARRQQTDARNALSTALMGGGRGIGIPRRLSEKIAKRHAILVDGEVAGHLNGAFPSFLAGFLRGRPGWLG